MTESVGQSYLIVFSTEFARVVTAPTNDDADWVARNGKESIYAMLKETFPRYTFLVGALDPFSTD